MSGCVGSFHRVSSNPEQDDGPVPFGGSFPRQRQQLLGRDGRLDVPVRQRQPRPRQVDVGVDEPRHDRRPRQVDHPIRMRRVAAPHALDVPVVDQDPLAGLRVRERVHAGGAVEGPHVAAIIAVRTPAGTLRPRSSQRIAADRPRGGSSARASPEPSDAHAARRHAERRGPGPAIGGEDHDVVHPADEARTREPERVIPDRQHGVGEHRGRRPARPGARRCRRPGTRAATTRSRRSVPAGRRASGADRRPRSGRSMRSTRGRRSTATKAHGSPDAGRHRATAVERASTAPGAARGGDPSPRDGSRATPCRARARCSARSPTTLRANASSSVRIERRRAAASRRSASGPPASRSAGAVRVGWMCSDGHRPPLVRSEEEHREAVNATRRGGRCAIGRAVGTRPPPRPQPTPAGDPPDRPDL